MVSATALSTIVLSLVASASAAAVAPEKRTDMYYEVQGFAEDDCSGSPVLIASGTNPVQCSPVPGGQAVNAVMLKGHNVLFGMNEKYTGTNPPACHGWNSNIYPNEGACQKTWGRRTSYWIWQM